MKLSSRNKAKKVRSLSEYSDKLKEETNKNNKLDRTVVNFMFDHNEEFSNVYKIEDYYYNQMNKNKRKLDMNSLELKKKAQLLEALNDKIANLQKENSELANKMNQELSDKVAALQKEKDEVKIQKK